MTDDIFDTTALTLAGVAQDGPLAQTVGSRANILAMTAKAEAAVLTPSEPGAFSHDWRLAVAARIATLHGVSDLSDHYRARLGDSATAGLCDPAAAGDTDTDRAVLRFMDRVAQTPRDVMAPELAELQSVGISDADIVRLCELNAFLAYQAGLVRGLSLLAKETAHG